MKKILFLLTMLMASGVFAATNEFTGLTVTNSLGDIYSNLTFARAEPDGLMFNCPSGMLKAKWEKLPDWCKEKYEGAGLERGKKDLEAARAAQAFQRTLQTAQAEATRELAESERRVRMERAKTQEQVAMAGIWLIKGRIIQRTKDGLLISSDGGDTTTYRYIHDSIQDPTHTTRVVASQGSRVYDGACLLTDYHLEAALVDGQEVCVSAQFAGQYSYTTITGAKSTVRQFKALY